MRALLGLMIFLFVVWPEAAVLLTHTDGDQLSLENQIVIPSIFY